MSDKKLKEIESFLENDSSIIERGKRYHEDVPFLLDRIARLANHNHFISKIPSTAQISNERSNELLVRILALVNEYYQTPSVCGI